ncbi:MAG: calcium-binding protein, partial [Planctomycetota bacterium]|nr:calcium-binding protein [Planctomycetota bacterium]
MTGGSLNDTLTGNSLANTLTGGAGNDALNGGAGNDRLVGGAGNDILSGGTGDDAYAFAATSALGTDTLDETAGGVDTLDFTGTTAALTVNLSVATTQVVGGTNLSLVLGSASVFENIVGGAGADVFIGNDLDNVLNGGAGNDTLTGGAGNDLLVGGAGNDTYKYAADAALGSDTLDESGGGIDALDFSTTVGSAVSIDLGVTTPQAVNQNLTLTILSASAFENVMGGALGDTLTGNANANTLTGNGGNDVLAGGAGNDLLTGGAGDDVYAFTADSALGSDTLNETGGGIDTLDFSATAGSGVTINLGLATAQVVNANLTLILGSISTFENVVGGVQGDTIIGNANANILSGGAGNDTLTGGAGNDSLIGGTGNDVYAFTATSALGTDTLDESAGGTDTLDFTGTTAALTVNLGVATTQVIAGTNLSLILGSATVFENVTGGSGIDTLVGNSPDNVLSGAAGNDILTGGAGNDLLVGGAGNDTYKFAADAALDSDTLDESGGGVDTL